MQKQWFRKKYSGLPQSPQPSSIGQVLQRKPGTRWKQCSQEKFDWINAQTFKQHLMSEKHVPIKCYSWLSYLIGATQNIWIGLDQLWKGMPPVHIITKYVSTSAKMGPIVSLYLQITVKGSKQTWVIGSDKMCSTQHTSCTVSLMLNSTSCLRLPHPRNPPALLIGNAKHSSKTCSRQSLLFTWYFCLSSETSRIKVGVFLQGLGLLQVVWVEKTENKQALNHVILTKTTWLSTNTNAGCVSCVEI